METIYDWVTIAAFAGLIVLFLQRTTSDEPERDSIWHYLPPAAGCAIANYFGNHEEHVAAIASFALVVIYTLVVLKPFAARPR